VATPASTQKRVRSIRLTPRGIIFLIAGGVFAIVAYVAGNSLLLLVGCLLLGLSVIAILLARFRSMRLAMVRSFSPAPVSATTPTTVSLDTANLARISSAPLYWNDTLPWRPLATDPVHLRPLSGQGSDPRSRTRLSYTLTPPRRGVFRIGPLAVAYSDPFGLAVGFMTVGGKDELIVTPHVTELPQSGVWLEAPDGAARLVQASGVGNSDDLMTREYRRGDALRRVHWRASARHGELMVRQEEQRAYPEATIVIDTREGGYSDHHGYASLVSGSSVFSRDFEWAVTMLASLGIHLHREGFVVHVTETSERQVIELADDESRVGRENDFLLSLASIHLTRETGKPAPAPADGPVFAILSEPDEHTLEWLLGLRRPFEIGVVFLIGADAGTAGELNRGGWRVIPVDYRTSPALAWRVLAEELGATSAGR
jgi:uncharacterized protein (DUF58 family)